MAVLSAPALGQSTPAGESHPAPSGASPEPPAAGAQAPSSAPQPTQGEAPLSEEDRRALEEAFGEAPQEQPPAPTPAPTPATTPPATGPGSGPGGLFGLTPITSPNIAVILDVAGAAFSDPDEGALQTGGHDPTRNGFNLQQLEMALGASVDPYMRFDANLVFSQFGVEIEEAYATSLDLPAGLQVRGGQFLTRFGRLNSTHPHAWDFMDQPFVLGRVFGGEGNRGLGVEASWLAPLPWSVEVVGAITDAHGESTARSFFGPDPARVTSPLDLQLTGAVKQFFELSDDVALLWGVSAATGPNASGHRTRTDVYGTDLFLKWRPVSGPHQHQSLTLQVEALLRRRQVAGDLLQDGGGYAQLVYRFVQRWATGLRYEYGAPATGLSGEGRPALDPLDPEWTAPRQRVSASLTFYPTEFSRFRLQGNVDAPRWRDRPISSVFLAGELVVGAHGAHPF